MLLVLAGGEARRPDEPLITDTVRPLKPAYCNRLLDRRRSGIGRTADALTPRQDFLVLPPEGHARQGLNALHRG
jgi:hypothetical protein